MTTFGAATDVLHEAAAAAVAAVVVVVVAAAVDWRLADKGKQ